MIIVRLSGGMGNQMFQYALGRKLSTAYNVPLKLDTTFLLHRIKVSETLRPNFVFREYDLDLFNIEATIAEPRDMKWWQRPILSGKIMIYIDAMLRIGAFLPGWEKSFLFDPSVLSIGPDAYLSGFWQSPLYFDSIKETLVADFSLSYSLPEHVEKLKKEIQETESLCLFVRRADMEMKQFHGARDVEYYKKGFEYINERVSVKKAYVFSDDIAWCKEHLVLPIETMFVDNTYAGEKWSGHMELMKQCKHFVIANSTFAWWPAWLATHSEKIVVAPQQWFNTAIDTKDLIPKTWIRL